MLRILGFQTGKQSWVDRQARLQCQHPRNPFSWSQGLGTSQPSSTSLNPLRPYVYIWFICLNLWQVDISKDLQLQPSPEERLIRRHSTQALQSLQFLDPAVPALWEKKKACRDFWKPLSIVQMQSCLWPLFAAICMDIIYFFLSLMQAEHPSSDSLRSLAFGTNLHW